jgi:hypothetical protein
MAGFTAPPAFTFGTAPRAIAIETAGGSMIPISDAPSKGTIRIATLTLMRKQSRT